MLSLPITTLGAYQLPRRMEFRQHGSRQPAVSVPSPPGNEGFRNAGLRHNRPSVRPERRNNVKVLAGGLARESGPLLLNIEYGCQGGARALNKRWSRRLANETGSHDPLCLG